MDVESLMALVRNPVVLLAAGCLLSLGCAAKEVSSDDLGPGTTRYSLDFGGRTRSYIVHPPAGADLKKPLPLVIALHGGGGTAAANIKQTGFNAEADKSGFIVVHPNGTDQPRPMLNAMGRGFFYTWNAGSCCGYAKKNAVDDVGFIRALVAELRRQYSIDPRRIYATGISNGGMLSYRLACEAGDLIAAIGVVSGAQTVPACKAAQPVSVIHIHGSADQNVPLAGGVGAKALDGDPKPPVLDAIRFWAKKDGAAEAPQSSTRGKVRKDVYVGKGGEVVFYLIEGGGHSWPGGERMLDALDPPSPELKATSVIWQFLASHPKP